MSAHRFGSCLARSSSATCQLSNRFLADAMAPLLASAKMMPSRARGVFVTVSLVTPLAALSGTVAAKRIKYRQPPTASIAWKETGAVDWSIRARGAMASVYTGPRRDRNNARISEFAKGRKVSDTVVNWPNNQCLLTARQQPYAAVDVKVRLADLLDLQPNATDTKDRPEADIGLSRGEGRLRPRSEAGFGSTISCGVVGRCLSGMT